MLTFGDLEPGDIVFGVTRHQDKQKTMTDGKKPVPTSADDRDHIHLSSKGRSDAYTMGKEGVVLPKGLARVHCLYSPFARVEEMIHRILLGADYEPDSLQVTHEKDLGLTFYQTNWDPEGFIDCDKPDYLIPFVKDFYFPQPDQRPSIAKMTFGTLDALTRGLEIALQKQKHIDGPQGVKIGTHSDLIDCLAGALFGYFTANEQSRSGKVDLGKFPGHYRVGEFIQGALLKSTSQDNPLFIVQGKGGKHAGLTLNNSISLDQLKRKRDAAYMHTQL